MSSDVNTWFNFITHSFLPTSHTSSLERERLILLDSILTKSDTDVGRVISKEILGCKNKKVGYMFFPCLITDLCVHVGVTITKEEEKKSPQGAFSIEFKAKPKIVGASGSSESSLGCSNSVLKMCHKFIHKLAWFLSEKMTL